MPQFARPASDVQVAGWTPIPATPVTLFDKINEVVADDTNFIASPQAPSAAEAIVALSALTPPGTTANFFVRYRFQKDQAGGAQIDLTVTLYVLSTVIAQFVHPNINNGWTTVVQTLTAAQVNAITDYTNLRVGFKANQVGS